MRNFTRALFSLFIILIIFTSCSFKNKHSEPIYDNWKIKFSDNQSFAAPSFNDNSWDTINTGKIISVQNNNHYFWLRKSVNVPGSLKDTNIWLGFQKTNCAIQVYADGVYVGSR